MRLIDADATIKKLQEYVTEMECDIYYGSNLGIPEDDICDAVGESPTIEAEPVRHGEWFGTVCSACGESTSFYYDCDYCPRCGAKMDGDIPDETIHDNK